MRYTCKFTPLTLTLMLFQTLTGDTLECHSEHCSKNENISVSRELSRRKRFLLYPDGSSFQLVFCVQNSALITIGDIFLYGNTAALAWPLPKDPAPELFQILRGEDGTKRGDMENIHYLDADGRLVAKIPYKRPSIIKPVFSKRSTKDNLTFKQKLQIKLDKEIHSRRAYLKHSHSNEKTVDFHRTSRAELYEKLEKLFTAFGGDGKQCVLRKLCEAARIPDTQGSFLQEILSIVFTLPKGRRFVNEEHHQYDEAHSDGNMDCSELYPGCNEDVTE